MPLVQLIHPEDHNTLGLTYNQNHHVFQFYFANQPQPLFFSVCRHGEALFMHFSADKSALRFLKHALYLFIELLKTHYRHRYIMAFVLKPSVWRFLDRLPEPEFLKPHQQGRIYLWADF